MADLKTLCLPCKKCGSTKVPTIILNGYGRDKNDLECSDCGYRTNEDFKMKHCIKAWNEREK